MKPDESCFICRAPDHIAKNCHKKSEWERNKMCLSCRQRGHSPKNCPNKNEESADKKLYYNCGEMGHSLSICDQPLQDGELPNFCRLESSMMETLDESSPAKFDGHLALGFSLTSLDLVCVSSPDFTNQRYEESPWVRELMSLQKRALRVDADIGPTSAVAAAAAQKQKSLLQRVDADVGGLVNNFGFLVNVAQVNDPSVRNSEESFMMEMRAARMVQAADSLLKLVSELKQKAVSSGFAPLNSHVDQRSEEFNKLPEDTNSKLTRVG